MAHLHQALCFIPLRPQRLHQRHAVRVCESFNRFCNAVRRPILSIMPERLVDLHLAAVTLSHPHRPLHHHRLRGLGVGKLGVKGDHGAGEVGGGGDKVRRGNVAGIV